jgi:hypothetical protein
MAHSRSCSHSHTHALTSWESQRRSAELPHSFLALLAGLPARSVSARSVARAEQPANSPHISQPVFTSVKGQLLIVQSLDKITCTLAKHTLKQSSHKFAHATAMGTCRPEVPNRTASMAARLAAQASSRAPVTLRHRRAAALPATRRARLTCS